MDLDMMNVSRLNDQLRTVTDIEIGRFSAARDKLPCLSGTQRPRYRRQRQHEYDALRIADELH